MLGTRFAVVIGRRKLELAMLAQYLRDGWAQELWRSRRQPFHVPSSPPTIGIELTNVCQLRCPHCDAQHPMIRGAPGYMSDATFTLLVQQLRELRLRNLRVIGGGEPLLHPKLIEWLPRLRGLASLVSITTNGQRLTEPICEALVANLNVVEISVASDHAAGFNRSRTGGNFDELLVNLERLRTLRNRHRSRAWIHIRVMLRPSELPHLDRLLAFWQRRGDVVSTQRLQDYHGEQGDVFVRGTTERYPSCTIPFRSLGVAWDGDVPLCRVSAFQTGTPQGVFVGNIHETTLAEIWRGTVLQMYREGHRSRDGRLMPLCQNCPDPQRPTPTKVFDTNANFKQSAGGPGTFVPLRALARRAERVPREHSIGATGTAPSPYASDCHDDPRVVGGDPGGTIQS